MAATRHWIDPMVEEKIPHNFGAGNDGETIPLYTRLPLAASSRNPVPTILLITGLDGYRCDNTQRSQEFLNRGWACVIVEIPGTADCPADPKDPNSPDRLYDSVLKWMSQQKVFDMDNVVAWGLSCGGYYAVRIAHTHATQLRGAVAQGAGVHHFFDEEWLKRADDHEYPFKYEFPTTSLSTSPHRRMLTQIVRRLIPALVQKFGYSSVDDMLQNSQKDFSLLSTGIMNQPSTRLLLINVGVLTCGLRLIRMVNAFACRVLMTGSCQLKTP